MKNILENQGHSACSFCCNGAHSCMHKARNQTEQARVCRRDDQDRTTYQEGADTHVKFWAT
jgi:hypothetical protein